MFHQGSKLAGWAAALSFFVAIFVGTSFLSAKAQTDGSAPADATGSATSSPVLDTTSASSSVDPVLPPPQGGTAAGSALPATSSPAVGVAAQAPSSSTPPRPAPTQPAPAPSPTVPVVTNETSAAPVVPPASAPLFGNSNFLIAGIALLAVLSAGALGLKLKNNNKKTEGKEGEEKCGNIKQLLEQKKKELEEMVKGWPEEKIKEMVKEKVLGDLKKDEDAKIVVDALEGAKAKYDELVGAIEMLQKRFDLCMLSLPEKGTVPYQGILVENSLSDKEILKNIDVQKSYRAGSWLLHDVSVNEKQIEKLGGYLNNGPWYMHFWQSGNDDVIIVFKNKSFSVKYSDRATWREAIRYGISIGIPEEQMDFKVRE